jgi:hypothetical protein
LPPSTSGIVASLPDAAGVTCRGSADWTVPVRCTLPVIEPSVTVVVPTESRRAAWSTGAGVGLPPEKAPNAQAVVATATEMITI